MTKTRTATLIIRSSFWHNKLHKPVPDSHLNFFPTVRRLVHNLFTNFFKYVNAPGESVGGHAHEDPPKFEDNQLAMLIDPVLKHDDLNNDGMIDYPEFISAQLRTKRGERPVIELAV